MLTKKGVLNYPNSCFLAVFISPCISTKQRDRVSQTVEMSLWFLSGMAEARSTLLEQDIQKKREETRKRFVIEYAQDSSDSYDARDMDRLWKDDVLVDSYLECSHFVMENTLKMISDSLQWRKEFKLNDINESSVQKGLLDSGMIYLHGYDKEGNKLFWFRVRLHVKDLKMLTEKKRYVAFWLESHVRREPGTPLTVIFDMSEDMEFIKYIINCFHVYYPKLLAKMLMYEMPWIMNAAWKMVKAMLSQEVVDTLVFVSKSEIQDHVEREHLLPSMGGTDPFKFSYPPFPDDFQNPISETGQEDDAETGEDDLETKDTLEQNPLALKPRKVCFAEDWDKDCTSTWKASRRPSDAFKGTLLHISPAEELRFGLGDGEKRCLISLSNVTRNRVAFKVRTTAPEKYRVKPSNSSCGPGTGGTITVSLYGGSLCCPQDRFLIMAAEMDLSSDGGSADLAQFWKGVPKPKIMMHRLRCRMRENLNLALSPVTDRSYRMESIGRQDVHATLFQLMASSSRLEENMDRCLRWQKVLTVLVTVLTALSFSTIYTGEWPL
ncbi:motile sperm domain-containing protein 2 isoform X2 [Esox lucius]|uniref:motile sperm domain-containing protein 2 isoform X2 n=1 Tax=Esox lucius TaxID=8010 RepID=UPI0014774C45|nr:motile sperm domain-containing protein 2 isoform X2 [Esox lucius]